MDHEIIVNDNECWVCGNPFDATKDGKKTMHHTLPRHIKPKKNVVIPICTSCHEKVTSEDTSALINFAYKTLKMTSEIQTMLSQQVHLLDSKVKK